MTKIKELKLLELEKRIIDAIDLAKDIYYWEDFKKDSILSRVVDRLEQAHDKLKEIEIENY